MDYPELPKVYDAGNYSAEDMRAFVDADRAQRAAPVVPAPGVLDGHAVIEKALSQALLGDTNNSPAGLLPDVAYGYQQGLAAAYQHALEMIPAAQPPQQSAQPVAIDDKPVAEFTDSFIFIIRHQPNGKKWPAGTKLYAAAQPVEVQRVPLTDDELELLQQILAKKTYVHPLGGVETVNPYWGAVEWLEKCADSITQIGPKILAAHGIKPTSTEGGE